MVEEPRTTVKFDFDAHRESAVAKYAGCRERYDKFAYITKNLLDDILQNAHVRYLTVEARTKSIKSFGDKAVKPLEEDPTRPKYPNPLEDIKDLAANRVITFLPRTVEDVCKLIEQEFSVLPGEKVDKAEKLWDEGKFGYKSIHYLVQLPPSRTSLPEYQTYHDLILEIQVRTVLQHAWAEMEHDIQYKSTKEIPALISRRFIALAGLLEIADREFQTIQDESENKKQQKASEIKEYIMKLNKMLEEGNETDKNYAKETLRDLSLLSVSEKSSVERDLEDHT